VLSLMRTRPWPPIRNGLRRTPDAVTLSWRLDNGWRRRRALRLVVPWARLLPSHKCGHRQHYQCSFAHPTTPCCLRSRTAGRRTLIPPSPKWASGSTALSRYSESAPSGTGWGFRSQRTRWSSRQSSRPSSRCSAPAASYLLARGQTRVRLQSSSSCIRHCHLAFPRRRSIAWITPPLAARQHRLLELLAIDCAVAAAAERDCSLQICACGGSRLWLLRKASELGMAVFEELVSHKCELQ
jgi:hypothetical protein